MDEMRWIRRNNHFDESIGNICIQNKNWIQFSLFMGQNVDLLLESIVLSAAIVSDQGTIAIF